MPDTQLLAHPLALLHLCMCVRQADDPATYNKARHKRRSLLRGSMAHRRGSSAPTPGLSSRSMPVEWTLEAAAAGPAPHIIGPASPNDPGAHNHELGHEGPATEPGQAGADAQPNLTQASSDSAGKSLAKSTLFGSFNPNSSFFSTATVG